jgi:RNA polymerase subunit RPABC4/transcription elongation factor Spt4
MGSKSSRFESARLKIIKRVIENPEAFKACESCDTIVLREEHICPTCGAYRFTKSKKNIIKIAEEIQREISN